MSRTSRLLAAGLVLVAVPAGGGSATPAAAANPAPAFLTYDRPAAYQAVTTKDVNVPLRDGSYLSCDLYRPGTSTTTTAAGRFASVLFQYHGYGTNRSAQDPGQLQYLAQHGYNALQCNVRGSGGSPGPINIVAPQEGVDGYDLVEWLARQKWSTGDVGQVGYSYGAITAYRTAANRPPHLRTIVPQASFEDIYRDIGHLGGARGADVRGWLLGALEGLNTLKTPPQQLVEIEQRGMALDQLMAAHPLDDALWKQYAIDFGALKASGIPVLALGGWYDIYQRGMPAAYQRLPKQTWLVMNNVSHVESANPTFYGKSSGPTLAWLDHWLKHLKTAPLPSTHVLSYEMPGTGGHGWTPFTAWPPSGAKVQRLQLNGDNTLGPAGTSGSSSYPVDPTDGMPSYWNIGTRPDTAPIVAWHTAREAQRLHFATPALSKDLVLAGSVHARITAAFSATDGYLVARLSDVAPDGTTTLVATGWRQASVPPPYTRRVVVTPGSPQVYDVEIWPSHWRFLAGHRLQVSISSGDVPRIHPDAPAGTVTVSTGTRGSVLDVPVLPAR